MTIDERRASSEQKGLERILALSDGVFAFAITLLVLGLTVPSLISGEARTSLNLLKSLSGEFASFYSYGLSFFIIAVWWVAHHRVFRYIVGYDSRLMWQNLLFLLFITIIPFLTELLNQYGDIQAAVVIYDISQFFGGLALSAVWSHATNKKHSLVANTLTQEQIRNIRIRGYVVPLTFLITIGIVFVLPTWISPSVANFALIGIVPLTRLVSRRKYTKD